MSADRDDDATPEWGDLDEQRLYELISRAVEDAILNALGTVLLLGVALLVIGFGAIVAVESPSLWTRTVGVLAIVGGLVGGARLLRLIPPLGRLV